MQTLYSHCSRIKLDYFILELTNSQGIIVAYYISILIKNYGEKYTIIISITCLSRQNAISKQKYAFVSDNFLKEFKKKS